MKHINTIFDIRSDQEFNALALEIFNWQHQNNAVYRRFCDLLQTDVSRINTLKQIPFLPIEFFKTHDVVTGEFEPETIFLSSGTTAQTPSRHLVKDLELYRESYTKGFERMYG
ncbi:MAG: hypothetical protein KDD41_06250 [Flavobacteriales bacterium]|nr:hypothetical protein [Flavobacteriales bacterium]